MHGLLVVVVVGCFLSLHGIVSGSDKPINGGFTSWSTWQTCSRKCGGGTTWRHRTCTNPTPRYGGKNCQGNDRETRACNTPYCPVNGGFSSWSPWGSCSRACEGTQRRTRSCTNPAPRYRGMPCQGRWEEIQPCNTQTCSDYECESNKVCIWPKDKENDVWGYYSKTNGECQACKDRCSADAKCGAVECNVGYCTWWKQGMCQKRDQHDINTKDLVTCNKQPDLSLAGATASCNALGWSVTWTSDKSLICTAPGTKSTSNCDSCATWRLFVWIDGGTDQSTGGHTYHTKAGRSYGGHQPCLTGWNLPVCPEPWKKVTYEQLPETTRCSEGMYIDSFEECAKAVAYLKITSSEPLAHWRSHAVPRGCFQIQNTTQTRRRQGIYFNSFLSEYKRSGMKCFGCTPICMKMAV